MANHSGKDEIPWPVILTALLFALISAWLVLFRGWEPWVAFSVVVTIIAGVILALIAMLFVLNWKRRAEIWPLILTAIRKDLAQIWRYFRGRQN